MAAVAEPVNSIRSIVLLEPKPPDIHIFRQFALPRLGVVLLGTILRDLGYDVTVMVEEVQEIEEVEEAAEVQKVMEGALEWWGKGT